MSTHIFYIYSYVTYTIMPCELLMRTELNEDLSFTKKVLPQGITQNKVIILIEITLFLGYILGKTQVFINLCMHQFARH